jgi:hypothetical protein
MSGRWKRLRASVLDRDGHACRSCSSTERLEVDHVHEIEDGGSWSDPANLQTLCRDCHTAKSSLAAQRRAGTFARNCYLHPEEPGPGWRGIVAAEQGRYRSVFADLVPIMVGPDLVFMRPDWAQNVLEGQTNA